MSQGLQIFRANGTLRFQTGDRLGRVLKMEPWESSAIPSNTWTKVIPTGYAGDAWGVVVPLYPLDLSDWYNGHSPGFVLVDALNRPGQILCSLAKSSDRPAILIYGVY